MKTALFIGRFQPFHNGHLDAIKQIFAKGFEKVIVGVGSAQEEHTQKNPFSYYERKEMVLLALKNFNVEVFPIPDFGNNEKWTNYILQNIPDFEAIVSGNPQVEVCFKNREKKFIRLEIRESIKGTNVREMIRREDKKVNELLKKEVLEVLKKFGAKERLEKLIENKLENPYFQPSVTADGIIRYGNGIVLIERGNEPFKGHYALPGGFLDENDEDLKTTLIREMKEEINLELQEIREFKTYSKKNRDPRNRVITTVFTAIGIGEIRAGDDAKRYQVLDPRKAIDLDLAFDHKQIILDYLNEDGKKEFGHL